MSKYLLFFLPLILFAHDAEQLMRDLNLLDEINEEIHADLPFIYSNILMGGYVNMPSARMQKSGNVALGLSYTPPYIIYGLNFQAFNEVELSGNYRVFRDRKEVNFGHMGFGDDADRTANVKFSVDYPFEFQWLPKVAVGFEDFFGSQRFYSAYIVATQKLIPWGIEASLGWGKGRIKGPFGALAWSPTNWLTFLAEYDAIDYENHHDEHEKGRTVKSRVNAGAVVNVFDAAQLKLTTLRGNQVSAMFSLYYNFGETDGLFPKFKDPKLYTAPCDLEPIGLLRTEKALAHELSFAFEKQGLSLTEVRLYYDEENEMNLYIRLINLRYWRNRDLKERLVYLLAHLMPENISATRVVIEEGGLEVESYTFRTEDLTEFREGKMGDEELAVVAPAQEVPSFDEYNSTRLYYKRKSPWVFDMSPEFITFFGSTRGKVKGSIGIVGALNGYIRDDVFYSIAVNYHLISSLSDVGSKDQYNPSQLLNVRSDLVNYYKTQTVSLIQAYLQKGWNVGDGWFCRLAGGYFEIAYGGIGAEALYYPIGSPFAIGIEGAALLKRDYKGLGFTTKVRKLNGFTPEYVDYVGAQGFINLYYDFKPLNLDFHIKAGYFLARDVGARFEVSRYYPSGLRVGVWLTATNGGDVVNGKHYNDKGVSFTIPFDVFLPKSARAQVGYGISAWLRDVGAFSATGNELYPMIHRSRIY
ncbi:MAG: YjbH domain-containing protein [Simkaniaceae bacterium]|nr:YjbH domain-containing protein [Simkaniaceae bacterium]